MVLQLYKTVFASCIIVFCYAEGFCQISNPTIDVFEISGNRNTRIAPGETANIIVTAQATGTGTFVLRTSPRGVAFASNWETKITQCTTSCTLSDTLTLNPSAEDCGIFTIDIIAEITGPNGHSKWEKKHVVSIIPKIRPEPPFTNGLSNEICWTDCDKFLNELVFFPNSVNKLSNLFEVPSLQCSVIEGLSEKQRYGYYLKASPLKAVASPLFSDTTYSTQDNTPPPPVVLQSFDVDPVGTVTLHWPFQNDAISFIDRYIIRRTPTENSAVLIPIDTLSYFPASGMTPENYMTDVSAVGKRLYVDSDETITKLPTVIAGLTMLKTAAADKWNESTAFLTFTLHADSYVYVAVDRSVRSFPKWLRDDFQSLHINMFMDQHPRGLRIYRSRVILPAGKITLGGNFAAGADIGPNLQPAMYAVFIKPINATFPFEMGDVISYQDPLGPANDLKAFQYRIDGVDAAGNTQPGVVSEPIILDLSGHCRPQLTDWFEFLKSTGEHFGLGTTRQMCILDPATDPNCISFRQTDSLRFQIVREEVALFENPLKGALGSSFFDSGWLSKDDLNPEFCHTFNLLPSGKTANFVNGQEYFIRIQGKDTAGNISAWSDTVSTIQDAFPPSDITNLTAVTRPFQGLNNGCIDVTWLPALDPVSGVASYSIFRSDDSGLTFSKIATVPGTETTYCDTLSDIGHSGIVHYRIGSVDNVGNKRDVSTTAEQVSIQALNGPFLSFDASATVMCHTGVIGTQLQNLAISWDNFEENDVVGFDLEIHNPSGESVLFPINEPLTRSLVVALDNGDGLYAIRIRTNYPDGLQSIFSNTIEIKLKTHLGGVENLQAVQDPTGSGDIKISWSHPDASEIVRYEILALSENGTIQQSEILPADSTSWIHNLENLKAYECTVYQVKATDCFGLQSESDPQVSQYANPALTFLPAATQITNESITIAWSRPDNRFKADDTPQSTVLIYEDNFQSIPDTLSVFRSTVATFHDPMPEHNYIFIVQETILDDLGQSCSANFTSRPSLPMTVPFENKPDSVSFVAQPLPVLPGQSLGNVFVTWQEAPESINRFRILWDNGTRPDSVDVFDVDSLLVKDLDINLTYLFRVFTIDSLEQRSGDNRFETVDFTPQWKFTPKLRKLNPACFRDDIELAWTWLENDLSETSNNFRTDSIFLEISIDPNFVFNKTTVALGLTTKYTFTREDYPFITQQNTDLYARIRSKDKWNHLSPWSTQYPELGMEQGQFDDIAPQQVICIIDSVKAPAFGQQNEVNVHLKWVDTSDNCSGVWYYEILRNDKVISRDTSRTPIHRFIDRRLKTDDLTKQEWRIHAVDSVGNRQNIAVPTMIPFVLNAPKSGQCQDDTTFCWTPGSSSIPGLEMSYIIEGVRFVELFGVGAEGNITAGPLTELCFNFQIPWENIFWRVKTKVNNFESAWSDTFSCVVTPLALLTGVDSAQENLIPEHFALSQNYPNPFNPETRIEFSIPEIESASARVLLQVFNMAGQRIRTLIDDEKQPGRYKISWNGKDDAGRVVGTGVYIYQLKTKGFIQSRKMIFVK